MEVRRVLFPLPKVRRDESLGGFGGGGERGGGRGWWGKKRVRGKQKGRKVKRRGEKRAEDLNRFGLCAFVVPSHAFPRLRSFFPAYALSSPLTLFAPNYPLAFRSRSRSGAASVTSIPFCRSRAACDGSIRTTSWY